MGKACSSAPTLHTVAPTTSKGHIPIIAKHHNSPHLRRLGAHPCTQGALNMLLQAGSAAAEIAASLLELKDDVPAPLQPPKSRALYVSAAESHHPPEVLENVRRYVPNVKLTKASALCV